MVNVYEQYFSAKAEYNSVSRHAALVMLIADSEVGNIRYEAAVTFSHIAMKRIMPYHTTPISAKCFMRPKVDAQRKGKKHCCKSFSSISMNLPKMQTESFIGIDR